RARLEERALGPEDVTQVPVLELLVRRLAHAVLGDEELDAARAVLQRAEARLPHHALLHEPTGHGDLDRLRLELLVGERAVLADQVGRAVLGLEVVGKGYALAPDRGKLLAALGDQLVVVLRRGGGVHGRGDRWCESKPRIVGGGP